MSKQYIVFFGTGKTTWCKTHLNWVELDIGWYNILKDKGALSSLIYFYTRWDYNLLFGGGSNTLFFINHYLHDPMNKTLFRPNYNPVKFNIIIPAPEIKDEILARIKARSCQRDFEYISSIYDKEWQALDSFKDFDTKVYLKSGQYLSDIIDENGNYKPNIEVIYSERN